MEVSIFFLETSDLCVCGGLLLFFCLFAAYMFVYPVQSQRRVLDSLELKLQMVMNHHVEMLLATEPSL